MIPRPHTCLRIYLLNNISATCCLLDFSLARALSQPREGPDNRRSLDLTREEKSSTVVARENLLRFLMFWPGVYFPLLDGGSLSEKNN